MGSVDYQYTGRANERHVGSSEDEERDVHLSY